MNRVIILQARMTSSRLPGKVLMDLAGKPMLAQQLSRLKRCRAVDDIVVATTENAADDAIVAVARGEGVRWFRGSEHDVLARFVGAACEANADVVIRITADCPLIDPEQSDRVIETFCAHRRDADYASNVVQRTFPVGLDTEALFRDTLERTHRLAQSPAAREHVTWLIHRECPALFRILSVTDNEDNSDLRWVVDVPEDLQMARRLYEALGLGEQPLAYREIVSFVRAHPEVVINAPVVP